MRAVPSLAGAPARAPPAPMRARSAVISGDVISGDVISGDVISGDVMTDYTVICDRLHCNL